jgi:uncharacterized membrane protein YraQ (UPF0718 family)
MADVPPVPVGYARRPRPRRWSRRALVALVVVLAAPLVSGGVLYLTDRNLLPQHLLCCRHPELGFFVLVVFPLAGSVTGCAAVPQIRRHRASLRGRGVAVTAVLLGAVLAAAGAVVFVGLKA